MTHDYRFEPELILRTPAGAFLELPTADTLDARLAEAGFREALFLASPVVAEEVEKYRAGQLTDPKRQAKLRAALARYAARRASRCTPFGLFAGCAVVRWGAETHLTLDPAADRRHTRLDMHYLCALAQVLAARDDIRPRLRYWPNSSWYALGAEIRYIEYHYAAGQLVHEISALGAAEYVAQALAACAGGLPYADLVAQLAPDPAEQPEAAAFVDALIAAQVLVSELEPTVTGVEFLDHLRRVLDRLAAQDLTKSADPAGAAKLADADAPADADTPADADDLADADNPANSGDADDSADPAGLSVADVARVLAEVAARLAALDAAPAANAAADYGRIVAALTPLGAVVEADKLFQTDATRGVDPAADTLNIALQTDLLAALAVLARLTPPAEQPRLTAFRAAFEARYETREVPLLQALDAESGLAYSDYGRGAYSPLVHDLALPAAPAPGRPAPPHAGLRLLRQKLREAERCGDYAIELDPAEVLALPDAPLSGTAAAPPLPPSLSVMFRPVGGGRVLLDTVGGSSAVNLLGRFAHADARVEALVRGITAAEQAHNPAVAFAELCHLPASRIGNILLRPSFRALEIPYLAQSGLPAEAQARPQDLTLRLRQGQLELHSARTGQRLVPRLSTAHNYAAQALPVYELLADLQTQGLRASLGFRWETVVGTEAALNPAPSDAPETRFWPRLSCGRVVLEAASWQLGRADYAALLAAAPADVPARLAELRARWRLPRRFTLADADNELLVDADNALLVQTWLDTIRQRPHIRLREFLFDPASSPVRDAAGRAYAAQFVALLVRQSPCYPAPAAAAASAVAAVPVPALAGSPAPADSSAPLVLPAPPAPSMPRRFVLGSEWLYYKLYCGPTTANRVLRELVGPLAETLRAAGLADYWFFIRYADPDPHLRVRFHLPDPARHLGQVLRLAHEYLDPALSQGYLWRVQTDTYQRELERYGPHTIALVEQLFHWQSEALLAYLTAAPAEADAPEAAEADATAPDPADEQAYWLWGLRAADELLRAFAYALPQRLALLRGLQRTFAQEFSLDKPLKRQLDHKYRLFRPRLAQALAAAPPPPPALRALAAAISQSLAAHPAEVTPEALLAAALHMLLNRVLPADARLHELVLYDFLARYYESALARI